MVQLSYLKFFVGVISLASRKLLIAIILVIYRFNHISEREERWVFSDETTDFSYLLLDSFISTDDREKESDMCEEIPDLSSF